MRYIIQILVLAGLIGSLSSCESLITTVPESKLPKETEKVVVHAYISPQDSIIIVKVGISTPLLGVINGNEGSYSVVGQDTIFYAGGNVENAIVVLSNSKKQSVEIPYYKPEMLYKIDAHQFPIEAGETYTLNVETPIGKVEATCTVPKENTIATNYKIDTLTDNINGIFTKLFRINFDWKDIAGQANYYTTKTTLTTPMRLHRGSSEYPPNYIVRTIKYYGYWNEDNGQQIYQTDMSRDGKVISSPIGMVQLGMDVAYSNGERYNAYFAGEKSTITLEVLNTDKNYYDYHRAVRINNRQDGNPFVEPVPIPTNIKNGLGCFAASNKSILTVVF
ncbi:DUF4249 domain-containing protein [Emticicia sp. C21]|uniref:DUF4249 domain-containing protein n=1 Tax=Emticicia sp. C21 TaxID=2302915 RepID=UPI000E344DE6|nr:DUF4249 domain-containing protein [Emticicia sp. C21]RFS18504.1 DUF4249 domain-containing protein [Emticicia sp. C21]